MTTTPVRILTAFYTGFIIITVPPVKKISYWSSDCYDESGSFFTTTTKRRRFSQGTLNKRLAQERQQMGAAGDEQEDEKPNSNRATHLLDMIRRVSGLSAPPAAHPVLNKRMRVYHGLALHDKLARECAVVRSSLMTFPDSTEVPVLLTSIADVLKELRFTDDKTDVCRQVLLSIGISEVVRRLEHSGEAEVTESLSGERSIRLLRIHSTLPESLVGMGVAAAHLTRYPLKFRKNKLFPSMDDFPDAI